MQVHNICYISKQTEPETMNEVRPKIINNPVKQVPV